MTALSTPPLAIVEESIPNARKRRRGGRTTQDPRRPPGFWVYIGLGRGRLSRSSPTTGRS